MKIIFTTVLLMAGIVSCTFAQKSGTMTDNRDGQSYKTVKIGNQWWMAENLNYYTSTGSKYYDNDSVTNAKKFGRLYDWNTASKASPKGWHLPTHQEWRYLEMELGFEQNESMHGNNLYGTDEGMILKDTLFWQTPNYANNETGFSALPGGHYAMSNFWGVNSFAHFWAGEKDSANAWYRSLANEDSAIHIFYQEKSDGYKSVRYVKDSIIPSGEYMGQYVPGKNPRPFGLGIVSNYGSNEHTVSFSPDGKDMYFTRDPDRKTFVVTSKNNLWTSPVSTNFNGREAIFSPDGSKLFFGDGDIWFVEIKSNGLTLPQKLPSSINTDSYEFYASITNDGNIYFSRFENDHPSIFVSRYQNGMYTEAIKLHASINHDSENNYHPFISPKGDYIIFNSDRIGGFGGADLYISFKNANGNWGNPINLGNKINSELRDICPTISPDGKYLFFTRNWEENGKWVGDIYWVDTEIINDLRNSK